MGNEFRVLHFMLKILVEHSSGDVLRYILVRYSGDRLWLEIEIWNLLSVVGSEVRMKVPRLGIS